MLPSPQITHFWPGNCSPNTLTSQSLLLDPRAAPEILLGDPQRRKVTTKADVYSLVCHVAWSTSFDQIQVLICSKCMRECWKGILFQIATVQHSVSDWIALSSTDLRTAGAPSIMGADAALQGVVLWELVTGECPRRGPVLTMYVEPSQSAQLPMYSFSWLW